MRSHSMMRHLNWVYGRTEPPWHNQFVLQSSYVLTDTCCCCGDVQQQMMLMQRCTWKQMTGERTRAPRHVHFQTSALQFRLWHEYILLEIFPTACFLINGCVQRPKTVSSDVETLDGKYIWQRCDENTFFSRIYWRKSIPHTADDDFINHSDVCLFRSVAVVVPDRLRATKWCRDEYTIM